MPPHLMSQRPQKKKKTWDKTLEICQEFLGTSRLITEKGKIDSPVD